MPPWAAAPLTIAPIACSRIPNGTLRPECTRENDPPPSNSVFVDSTRSAAPPSIVGACLAKAAIARWPAVRVAIFRVGDVLRVPSRRAEALEMALGVEGDRRRSVDRDVVVVVADDQLAEREMARDRRGLLADALHEVAVRADHVGVVVDERV